MNCTEFFEHMAYLLLQEGWTPDPEEAKKEQAATWINQLKKLMPPKEVKSNA